jgi:N,N'-diacetyllegionaminate synthase
MVNRCLIIAEAGVNHNGDINLAKRLVDVAAAAGADFVKFQSFNAMRLAIRSAPKADYQIRNDDQNRSQFTMLSQLELSAEMHEVLVAHCRSRSIGFLSSAFDIESLNFISSIGATLFKIPSGEITNLPYLRCVATFGKPLILSTGMATLGEIEAALDALEAAGTSRSNITVLHCNTEYPTPIMDVKLRVLDSLRNALGVAVGYSDHTLGIEVAIAAVSLGATVIEKHITLDRNLPGPDHKASLEPDEFAEMVRAIRNVEKALGDGIKRPSPSEIKNKLVVRKSLVALKPIRAGEPFTPTNVTVKRPGTGLSPMRWDEVMGQIATRDFDCDELLTL